jgi:murein DD-endopeptidase MepM/ murein hydrolase activator NlpD
MGTPVRSVGDGVVIFAGRKGGYGNVIDVRHRNGFVSRYGHLRGFARGIRGGSRVGIGSTIGYVGMSGLATGPHLHFEILVGGVQRDPRVALKMKGGMPIASSERGLFDRMRSRTVASFEVPEEVPTSQTAKSEHIERDRRAFFVSARLASTTKDLYGFGGF